MTKMKKPIILAITVVIVGLVITSTASSLTYEGQKAINTQSEIIYSTEMPISVDVTVCKLNHEKIITQKSTDKLSRDTDVLIITGEQDYQNPAIVADNSMNNILIFFEEFVDVGQTGMWGRFSTDGGETWSDEISGFAGIPQDDPDSVSIPKLDLYDGNEAWGTFTTGGLYDAMVYYLTLPDITDPEYGDMGWSYYYADWADNNDFHNFDSADAACYPYDVEHSPTDSFWGLVAGTGDRPPGEDFEDHTYWFSYFVDEEQITLISFYNLDQDAYKLVCDIDTSIGRPFFAYEYISETDPTDVGTRAIRCPLLRPDNYPDDCWWQSGFYSSKFKNFFNPDITAADKHVYVVGTNDEGDIKCWYSSNGGQNYRSSTVADATGEETYPQVTIFGSDVICSYTRNGNLYAKNSKDGGVTWGVEKQINDDDGIVVEQYGCSGVSGSFAAWTDERSDINEVYFDTTFEIGSPPATPIITGPTKLKPGQSKEFTFTATDPDGDQIYYYVDWGDGNTVDWQGPYPSGTPYKLTHSWSDKSGFTIKCKAKDINSLESNYGTLDISTPRNSGLIFRFSETFKHLFPNFWRIFRI